MFCPWTTAESGVPLTIRPHRLPQSGEKELAILDDARGFLGNCQWPGGGWISLALQFRKSRCTEDMPLLEICLIVTGVVIFTVANVAVMQHYFRGRKFRKKSEPVVYQPVEQDNMGHLYYWDTLQIRGTSYPGINGVWMFTSALSEVYVVCNFF